MRIVKKLVLCQILMYNVYIYYNFCINFNNNYNYKGDNIVRC